MKYYLIILFTLALTACGDREDLAPVVESNWRAVNAHVKQHRVVRGETLYAIAFRYDQDYRHLATINHLHAPYKLLVGQKLYLKVMYPLKPLSKAPTVRLAPYTKPHFEMNTVVAIKAVRPTAKESWLWPVHGKVVTNYSPGRGKKGIDIAGTKGQKIYAAKSGIVAYAGSGLAGYGNLIIVKHDNQYLTAYGNNSRNLVKEGQYIKIGQPIAEIGMVDHHYWGVHFEIRKAGMPVNPLDFLS